MSKSYWLVKQEPEAYSWSRFVADGTTAWTGVRNFQARNHLRTMALGDWVLYYHSVSEKRIVGIAEVVREAYPDPTADDGDWSCVDLRPMVPITQPVELQALRADKVTAEMALIRQSRLSVMPVTGAQMQRILELGGTELPRVKR